MTKYHYLRAEVLSFQKVHFSSIKVTRSGVHSYFTPKQCPFEPVLFESITVEFTFYRLKKNKPKLRGIKDRTEYIQPLYENYVRLTLLLPYLGYLKKY